MAAAPADTASVRKARALPQDLPTGRITTEVACPFCGGAGFVVPDLPIGHPEFGRAVPCRCRQQSFAERRLHALNALGALDTVRHLTFDRFKPEWPYLSPEQAFSLRSAFDKCLAYVRNPQGWLLLTGTYGCGKTHLAAAIANERLALGQPVIFMVVPDLLDHLRAAFSPQSDATYDELFEVVRTTPLLVLDDLGSQSSTPWAQEKLFQLLNHRYNTQLPTVVTTNQRQEDIDPRLWSRLNDKTLVEHIKITAPDFRTRNGMGSTELSRLNLHQDLRFDTFVAQRTDITSGERSNLHEALDMCVKYVEQPHGWLVLTGSHGCGKTHLAAAVANEYVERTKRDVMFVTAPDLLDHLRASYSPQSATSYDRRFDEVKRAPLLVLDDLGTESATPWAREKLYQLLSFRYNALLPTVITSSVEPKDIDPWLRTRMFDTTRCQYIAIVAPGYRTGRGPSAPPPGGKAPMRRRG